MTSRPRRSALYLPASNAKAVAKARTLPCDIVILDLEDAVAPNMKAAAREAAVAAVSEGGFGARELVVRVNGLETDWGADDLKALAICRPDALLIPKIARATDIAAYRACSADDVPLWAMIETAQSLFRLDEIAAADRMAALVMGTNDLARELNCRPGADRLPFLGALGLAVAAARAHGLAVLDGVFNDIADADGFMAEARQGARFGFDGKTLIHPSQIDPCNTAFTPDAQEVAWARDVVAAFDAPEHRHQGAIRLQGRMVERLHLELAWRTLAAAGQPFTTAE